MKKIFPVILFASLTLVGLMSSAHAGGWTTSATPTALDVTREDGFMLYGAFGNPLSCTIANQIFVAATAPSYKEIFAAALLAYSQGKSVQLWINSCVTLGWYDAVGTTHNVANVNASIKIVN